jgi:spermidine synthase
LINFEEQPEYEDKVVYTDETQFHKLVITQWHKDFWFYIDRLKNVSSIDEYLYYEPMVHSVFKIEDKLQDVLVIGGENGCLVREVLKYDNVNRIDLISYDTLFRNLGRENPYFIKMNKNAFNHNKVHVIHENLLNYLMNCKSKYQAIFIDLPDPRSIETNQYYTREFYNLVRIILDDHGIMITQAGSPYFATRAFYAIGQTIIQSGFHILPIHNQVLTLGEWGWYICSLSKDQELMEKKLVSPQVVNLITRWFNDEAAQLIAAFGKTYYDTFNVEINSMDNPLVYQYYLKGNWNLN